MSGLVDVMSMRDGAWRRVQLRGDRGNLLSIDLIRALSECLQTLASARGIKWLTIEGSGGEFSYGAKIQEHTADMMPTILPETHRVLKQLLAFPAPTAALVEGRCLGGAFELTLACDDIIAAESATFGLPEIRLGVFPPAAAAILPLRVGASRAARAIVTGNLQSAEYWHDAGLLSMVAPQSDIIGAASGWFETQLEAHSATALAHAAAASRLTLRAQAEPALDRAERDYLGSVLHTADAAEGMRAFLEKRAPQWNNE